MAGSENGGMNSLSRFQIRRSVVLKPCNGHLIFAAKSLPVLRRSQDMVRKGHSCSIEPLVSCPRGFRAVSWTAAKPQRASVRLVG